MPLEIDINAEVTQAIRNGIAKAVQEKLGNAYRDNPLGKLIDDAISDQSNAIRKLIGEGMNSALAESDFRENIKAAVRSKLASTLIQRFGGELEKQVNALKSDPTTRARITVAIEDIVNNAKA